MTHVTMKLMTISWQSHDNLMTISWHTSQLVSLSGWWLWPVCAHCHWAGAGKVSGWGWWPVTTLLTTEFQHFNHDKDRISQWWPPTPPHKKLDHLPSLLRYLGSDESSSNILVQFPFYLASPHLLRTSPGRKETYLLQESILPSGLLAGGTLLHCG